MIDLTRYPDDATLTHTQVAAWLGLDRSTVYRNAARWGLSFQKEFGSRRVVVRAADVKALAHRMRLKMGQVLEALSHGEPPP
jgi:predicted DNA-binding transcriptional regulator AlpA